MGSSSHAEATGAGRGCGGRWSAGSTLPQLVRTCHRWVCVYFLWWGVYKAAWRVRASFVLQEAPRGLWGAQHLGCVQEQVESPGAALELWLPSITVPGHCHQRPLAPQAQGSRKCTTNDRVHCSPLTLLSTASLPSQGLPAPSAARAPKPQETSNKRLFELDVRA